MSFVDVALTLEDDATKTARLEVHPTDGGVEMVFYIEDDNVLAVDLTTADALDFMALLLKAIGGPIGAEYKP